MKRNNWEVKDYGIRPAGSPNHCFYCSAVKGDEHKVDCVIRSRTIVMKMEVEMVLKVPEDWDKKQCEFHRNEGSWCSSNIIDELKRMDNELGCLCENTKFKFLREATEEDEKSLKVFVKDFPQ